MFSSLMPQRKEFFELLAAHSEQVVAGANATLRLINGLGDGSSNLAALVEEVNQCEHKGDEIKNKVIERLHQSFTTPINRDQIHSLISDLDMTLNVLQSVANAVGMYSIKQSTVEAREMAALSADACMRLNRAVAALGDKNRSAETLNLCKEVEEIESKADKVQHKAITALFQEGANVWQTMKMREFYALQEDVLDCCQEAAKMIEEILIENS
jgi:predicted phosphate transport protein (TIGR00153 family)